MKLLYVITPVAKYPMVVIPAKAGHEVKLSRYPARNWMLDQVRHDGIGHRVTGLITYMVCKAANAARSPRDILRFFHYFI